jgi:tetratricopeptide (TPR) repeat protein
LGLRSLVKSQPELARVCLRPLLNNYAELEVTGRRQEATRYLRLADKLALAYQAVLPTSLLTRQVALYRRWSVAQKREKIETLNRWSAAKTLLDKGDTDAALKIWLEDLEVERRLGDEWGQANSLLYISRIYHYYLRQPDEALKLEQQSLELNRRLGHKAGIATNYVHIGNLHEEKAPASASDFYLRGLSLSREVKFAGVEMSALIFLAELSLKLNQPQEAAEFYRQFLAITNKSRHLSWRNNIAKPLLKAGGLFLKLDLQQDATTAMQQLEELLQEAAVDAFLRGEFLTEAAELYEKTGQPATAAKFYDKALAGYREGNHHHEIGNTLIKIGILYKNQSLYVKALEFYQQALLAYEKTGNRLLLAVVADNVGIVQDLQGHYKQALQSYNRALGVYEDAIEAAGQDKQKVSQLNKEAAITYLNVGVTLSNLGKYETALRYFQSVESTYDLSGTSEEHGRIALNIGEAYFRLVQYDDAERYFLKALKAFEAVENQGGIAKALGNRGSLLYERGQYIEARRLHERALEILRRYSNQRDQAIGLINLARTYRQIGEYDGALSRLSSALKIGQDIGDHQVSWRARAGIASCLEQTNRPIEALDHYQAAITDIESLRAGIGNSRRDVSLKIDFFTTKLQTYTNLVKLMVKLSEQGVADYSAKAFEYADRARARGLVDLLNTSQALAQVEPSGELSQRVGEANELVDAYEGSLRLENAKPVDQRDQKRIKQYEEGLKQATRKQRSAQEELEEKYPRYVELMKPQPVTVAEVKRDMLREREVLIEYVVTADATFAFVVSKTGIKAVTLDISEKEGCVKDFV